MNRRDRISLELPSDSECGRESRFAGRRTMAKKQAQQLTLTIDGQQITAERFLKAVSFFVAIINDVSEQVTQERGAFRWIVSVERSEERRVGKECRL